LKSSTVIAGLVAATALATPIGAQAAPTQVSAKATAAAQSCPSNQLCLYGSKNYTNLKFQTAQVGPCWWLDKYDLKYGVYSYDNNLPVTVYFRDGGPGRPGDNIRWTIRPGGNSGDSSSFRNEIWVCTRATI
jgi:hypothetical protein